MCSKKAALCCDKATIFFKNVDFYSRIGIIRKYIDKCIAFVFYYDALNISLETFLYQRPTRLCFFYPEKAAGYQVPGQPEVDF